MGYSAFSEDFRVFNLRKQIVDESNHVNWNEELYSKDSIDHSTSILGELFSITYSKLCEAFIPYVLSILERSSLSTTNPNPEHHSILFPKSEVYIDMRNDSPHRETKVLTDEISSMPNPTNIQIVHDHPIS